MSHAVTNAVMKDCRLKGERRTLMLCLAHHSDEGGACWPSQVLLAEETNCSRRGVQKMIEALILCGEIELISAGLGRGNPAQYRLTKYAAKGEQNAPVERPKRRTHSAPISEEQKANLETLKGELGDVKGEPSSTKGERPQGKMYRNTNRIPNGIPKNTNGVAIPAELQTAEFLEAWERFRKHRAQKRKPLTGLAEEGQMRNLLEMGVHRAVAAINHSIAQGYQGIFEPKQTTGGHGKPTVAHDQKSKWGI